LSLKEERSRVPGYRKAQIMSDEHKMTTKDKLVLTITLAVIFFGIFALGIIGVIVNLSS